MGLRKMDALLGGSVEAGGGTGRTGRGFWWRLRLVFSALEGWNEGGERRKGAGW